MEFVENTEVINAIRNAKKVQTGGSEKTHTGIEKFYFKNGLLFEWDYAHDSYVLCSTERFINEQSAIQEYKRQCE